MLRLSHLFSFKGRSGRTALFGVCLFALFVAFIAYYNLTLPTTIPPEIHTSVLIPLYSLVGLGTGQMVAATMVRRMHDTFRSARFLLTFPAILIFTSCLIFALHWPDLKDSMAENNSIDSIVRSYFPKTFQSIGRYFLPATILGLLAMVVLLTQPPRDFKGHAPNPYGREKRINT